METICPHCGKELLAHNRCWRYTENYQKSAIVKTVCCGKLVTLYPISAWEATKYNGDKTEDDWGEKI